MKKAKFNEKTLKELVALLKEKYAKILDAKLNLKMGKVENIVKKRILKKDIARIKTELTKKFKVHTTTK